MEIEPFGYIDPDELAEFYSGEVDINGRNIAVDLNFESTTTSISELEFVSVVLLDMGVKVDAAFDGISDDFDLDEDSVTAKNYLVYHFEHLPDEHKIELFGTINIDEVDRQAFLSVLELTRVGLYPEEEEAFLVFNIRFPAQYTNYLIAVTFNREGYLSAMTMES